MINYSAFAPTVNPLEVAMKGFDLGQQITASRANELKIQQYEAGLKRKAEAQAALGRLRGVKDPEIIRDTLVQFPELKDAMSSTLESLDSEQVRRRGIQAMTLSNLIEGGHIDLANQEIDRQIEAMAGKDPAGSASLQAIKQMLERDPKSVASASNILAYQALGPDQYASYLEKSEGIRLKRELHPIEIENLQKQGALTDAQTLKALADAKKLGAEGQRIALELEGNLSSEKKFDKELDLNKIYNTRISGLKESRRTYDIIGASAEDESGASDIALVTSFMKMLDPGSVVRESEFATARDTAGLFKRLQAAQEQVKTGRFLTEGQRQDFVRLASLYLGAAEKEGVAAKQSVEAMINNYGLNPDNVFGKEDKAPEQAKTATTQSQDQSLNSLMDSVDRSIQALIEKGVLKPVE